MKPSGGMVVSAHPLASRAGAAVLKKGGNAFDAAIATSLMLGAVEPAFSGIGGGGFALSVRSSGEPFVLDYRETAPRKASPSMFEEGSDRNRVGALAIATPGLLAGHAEILERYGTMEFADLAGPAVEAAKSGARSSLSRRMLVDRKSDAFRKLNRFDGSSRVFLGRGGNPWLSKTLSKLASKGPRDFYRGAVPEKVSKYLRGMGGVLTEEDFREYVPRTRKPVFGGYGEYAVVSMPPPSAGGTLLVEGLRAAEGSTGRVAVGRTLSSMLNEKWRFGDPDFVGVPDLSLLGIRPKRRPRTEVGSTSHFSVVDRMGNAVAITETVECYYGSGVTVPELGVVLNDEMHDFDVSPGRPNSIAPMKRPASSMTPTILTRDGSPFLILGGAGSERIISSIFQTLWNVVESRLSLDLAVALPRIHPEGEMLEAEGGVSGEELLELRRAGFRTHQRPKLDRYFGGVHAIMVDPKSGKVTGTADPRRMGAAVAE